MDEKYVEENYNWDISKGDYKRSRESTRTHQKKTERKKIAKTFVWSSLYFVLIILLAYWFFSY